MTGQLGVVLKSSTLPILLRPAIASDVDALVAMLNNPRNTEFDPHAGSGNLTAEKLTPVISRWQEGYMAAKPGRVNLVVVDTTSRSSSTSTDTSTDTNEGVVVGLSGFGNIDTHGSDGDGEGRRVGDVGVMLNPDARGKGFAAEAMRMSIDYGFDGLALDEVTATMLAKNAAMVAVMARLGWEGGEHGRERIYSMTKNERIRWSTRRET